MITIYSIPAIIALIFKSVIFHFARRAKLQNHKTRLFSLAVIFSISLSLVEVIGLNFGLGRMQDLFGFSYYATLIPLNAIFAHLAIVIAFNEIPIYITWFIYAYVFCLEVLLLFSNQLIVGFEVLKGYTVTRVPGPLHGVYEVFMLGCIFAFLVLPFFGLRADRPPLMRSQCKLWIVAAAPFALVLLAIIGLLHFNIHLFNASVTTPLLSALFLAAAGYAVHNNRIIEVDFYIPWSRTRKRKAAFYSHVSQFVHELSQLKSVQEVINRLAATLNCPLVFISTAKPHSLKGGADKEMEGFPQSELRKINEMITIDEANNTAPSLWGLMQRHEVAAVVPFYPHSSRMASWLLLGRAFSQQVYTPLDFKVVEQLFTKLGSLLLDELIATDHEVYKGSDQALREHQEQVQEQIMAELKKLLERCGQGLSQPLEKPLDEHLSEIEALLLKEVLKHCSGNRSKAARFLGLRPNTLYYKMERYGLLKK